MSRKVIDANLHSPSAPPPPSSWSTAPSQFKPTLTYRPGESAIHDEVRPLTKWQRRIVVAGAVAAMAGAVWVTDWLFGG